MPLTLPPIKDPALQKFCEERQLYDTLAAAYHYVQKFFPTATSIELRFLGPYFEEDVDDYSIIFDIDINLTVKEVLEANDRFINATMDIPGAEYIVLSYRFTDHESS